MELLVYTWEVIKAIWPLALIMGIISIPFIKWLITEKREYESIKNLYDHPTASSNEPVEVSKKRKGYYCPDCKGISSTSPMCENPYCPDQPE